MMKFSLFVLLLVAAASAITPEQAAKLEKLAKPCREEVGITREDIQAFRAGQAEDTSKLKKYLVCMGKKVGFVNENGEIVPSVIKSRIRSSVDTDEKAEKIAKQCLEEKSNVEETLIAAAKCIDGNVPNFSPVE